VAEKATLLQMDGHRGFTTLSRFRRQHLATSMGQTKTGDKGEEKWLDIRTPCVQKDILYFNAMQDSLHQGIKGEDVQKLKSSKGGKGTKKDVRARP